MNCHPELAKANEGSHSVSNVFDKGFKRLKTRFRRALRDLLSQE